MSSTPLTRRRALQAGAVLAAGAALGGRPRPAVAAPAPSAGRRVQQSVVPWCFNPMPVPELAGHAARLGMKSVELVGTEHWPTLKKLGLVCAISGSHGFAKGFAHREEHEECLAKLRTSIDATAREGWPSVITFSGFRRGLSDEVGMRNMVDGLQRIAGYAEEKRVTLCLEMLNSKVNVSMKGHPDYFCDDIERSVEICRRVGSERVKVLFDIYHVQIMHGDVIRRIQKHHPYIGHYHTAGNPGRNEIDGTQEIHYPPIMKAILATGYTGYVGQEFIPLRDKVQSLEEAVRICDVAPA
ncbi:MAG: Hydroxypyruvate isomerase [Verrucomicrobiota bacterium]